MPRILPHHALRRGALVGLLALTPLSAGCAKKAALNVLADALSASSTGSFAQDDDLELVGDAIPFALETMMSLHAEVPEHRGLSLSLASGFTQYAMVWVQWPAEQRKYDDFVAYQAGLVRSRKLFLRARGYALEGMEVAHPGFSEQVFESPEAALQLAEAEDVPTLYWLAASWLAAISNSREDPELIGQLPIAAAVAARALELDEGWDQGSLHELMINVEPSLPQPGGAERAEAHFARALELNGGTRASTYVTLATAITVDQQDRERFVSLLEQALAVDLDAAPGSRLANVYAQQQARYLLDHIDDLFI